MHFAVLCSPDSWYLRDLQRAAAGQFEITGISFRDLAAEIGPAGRGSLASELIWGPSMPC